MHSVVVEETHSLNQPLLRGRAKKGINSASRQFVALVDNEEAGLLILEHFPCNNLAFVYEIYVLTEYRKIGVGNLLLLRAEAVALGLSCKTLRLLVRSLDQEFINDEVLMSWYSRKGFDRDVSEDGYMQKYLTTTSKVISRRGDD